MKPLIRYSAALVALLPTMLSAAEADDTTQDIIVTATGAPTATDSVGQAVSTLDRSVIETRQSVSIAELLATLPGVTISRNGGLGGFSAIRIRGAEGEQTLALIDGVKINDPSSPGGGFDFGSLLAGNIERIEVLRGPNSVPWGSEAIGGVVNIVTASPTDGFSGHARGEYGGHGAANLVGNLSGNMGPLRAALGAGWFTDDGVSAYRDGTERDGLRQTALNGRVELDLGTAATLDLRGYHVRSRIKQDGFPPPFYSFADTAELSRSEQTTGHAGLRLTTGPLASRLAVTLSDINRDSFATPAAATPQYFNRGRIMRYEYRGDWQAAAGLRAVFGAEHERSRITDGFSPAKTHSTGGHLQIIADPFASLTLTGGLRIDDHATYGTRTTLSANTAWRPTDTTTIRLAYGEGYKAPTLFQLYSFYGNATLRPETARSYDIGIEQRLIGDTLSASLTLFQRDTTNQIDYISCYGRTTGICAGRPNGTYDNIDKARAKGLEMQINLRPAENLEMTVGYSLLDAKDRTTGLALVRRPRNSLSAEIDWTTIGGAKIGASLRLASDSADTDFQTYQRIRLDGYALAGLRAAVPLTEGLEIYGRIDNLFDARYETVSGYGSYRRTAHAGVRARF